MALEEPKLDLIDEAFGPTADLYKDVLGVKPNVTAEQVQRAYFDRRNELFRLLADIDADEEQDSITASHRFHAERKMDAVVMAFRILGDPELRLQYDDLRVERVQRSSSPAKAVYYDIPEGSKASSKKKKHQRRSQHRRRNKEAPPPPSLPPPQGYESYESEVSADERQRRTVTPDQDSSRRSRRGKDKRQQQLRQEQQHPRQEEVNTTDEMTTDDEQDETVFTSATVDTALARRSYRAKGPLDALRHEVLGCIEDTSVSFEDVFSVFTLRDEDIRAVQGRIDKAKRQIRKKL